MIYVCVSPQWSSLPVSSSSCQHARPPHALVSLLHDTYFLMKAFLMLHCHCSSLQEKGRDLNPESGFLMTIFVPWLQGHREFLQQVTCDFLPCNFWGNLSVVFEIFSTLLLHLGIVPCIQTLQECLMQATCKATRTICYYLVGRAESCLLLMSSGHHVAFD